MSELLTNFWKPQYEKNSKFSALKAFFVVVFIFSIITNFEGNSRSTVIVMITIVFYILFLVIGAYTIRI